MKFKKSKETFKASELYKKIGDTKWVLKDNVRMLECRHHDTYGVVIIQFYSSIPEFNWWVLGDLFKLK